VLECSYLTVKIYVKLRVKLYGFYRLQRGQLSVCPDDPVQDSPNEIKTLPPAVRLVGGTESAGRLESYVFGEYRPVCSNKFDDTAATVACKTLGYQ